MNEQRETRNSQKGAIMSSPKRLARIAGIFYLLVGIFGGFAEGFVDPKMYVAGDAAATAGNVVANAGLVRMGVVAHLVDAVILCLPGDDPLPAAQARAQERGEGDAGLRRTRGRHHCLNAVFQFEGLQVATDAPTWPPSAPRGRMPSCCSCSTSSTMGPSPRRSSLACGWRRSGISPTNQGCSPRRWASCSIVATVCYLVDLLAAFLVPDFGKQIHAVPCHRAHHRGDLDGPVPARERGEGSRAGHPHRKRRNNKWRFGRAVAVRFMHLVEPPGYDERTTRTYVRSKKGIRMKAIVCTTYGSPDVLQLKEVAKPTPKDNEVLIKVHAAVVGPADCAFRKGEPFIVKLMYGLARPKFADTRG